MATQLYDNHNRPIQYLRLAVTDRCNLRCHYCMPENMQFVPRKDLLTYEEMLRLTSILASLGVSKVRITGGEPFMRRDIMSFLENLTKIKGIEQVAITTNGVTTLKYLEDLKSIGITSLNLSLDTLDEARFLEITRRDCFQDVIETMNKALDMGFSLKINAVVMEGKNTQDIIALTRLAQTRKIDVRFIEEMPFNGKGSNYPTLNWTYKSIIKEIKNVFPDMERLQDPIGSTSQNFTIPGFKGSVGVIPAFTRTFCSECNRIRVTALGILKTCLYDDGVYNLRDLLRSEKDDYQIKEKLIELIQKRSKDGFEAEKNRTTGEVTESMSTIGG